MKKRLISCLCVLAMVTLTACSSLGNNSGDSEAQTGTLAQTGQVQSDEQTTAQTESTTEASESMSQSESQIVITDGAAVKVGSLKGPTSMGLVSLMDQSEKGESIQDYDFTMVTAADELVAAIAGKTVDIATVPANVASVLYNKTQGGVSVIDINTLGVLYLVEGADTIHSVQDLKGRTIYLTGKGTTPDYVLSYILSANGLTTADVTLEYKSEATEVAAILASDSSAVGLLPEPFVTVACTKNPDLRRALDLTQEWDNVQGEGESQLVTGVTIVRNEFLEENEDIVNAFLEEHEKSTAFTNENPGEAAQLIANLGIVEKPQIAEKAIPTCNITYIDGTQMKQALSGYLQVLYDQNPDSVGGTLPGDDFYYNAQ